MPGANKLEQSWYRTYRSRIYLRKNRGWLKYRRHHGMVIVGFVVAMAGLWSVVAIFGPVLVAEAGYQMRNLVGGVTGDFGKWTAFRMPSLGMPMINPTLKPNEISMTIPKIYLQEKILGEVNPADKPAYMKALQYGVAHAMGTANPGEPGLGYYFAHSSGMNVLFPQKKAAFYLLGKLDAGDIIYISQGGQDYRYRVIDKKITTADDLSFLKESDQRERIVLQTCWPIGTSLKRLLVFADREN